MLLFQEQPDAIFLAILHEAMDDELAYLGDAIEDIEFFVACYPFTSRHFTPTLALQTLKQLRKASGAAEYYQLTDYHWELLYEVLRGYTECFNDCQDSFEVSNKYGLKEINFSALIMKFFWDTDFLQDGEVILALTAEQKEALGFAKETFGLTQGFAPHPEELILRPVEDNRMEERVVDHFPLAPSTVYPY
jgi:DNA-binding PadR family transcriptional regulator